jgi:hypothetical protein
MESTQFKVGTKPVLVSADQADPKTIHVAANGPLLHGRDRNTNAGKLEQGERLDITDHTWIVGQGHLPGVHVLVTTPEE